MGKNKIYSSEQLYFSLDSNFIFSNCSGQVSDFRTKFQVRFDLITKFWFQVNSGHAAKNHETKKQSKQREGRDDGLLFTKNPIFRDLMGVCITFSVTSKKNLW